LQSKPTVRNDFQSRSGRSAFLFDAGFTQHCSKFNAGKSAKNLPLPRKGSPPMSTLTNETMHGDHAEWSGDCNMWRDDIRAWQQDIVTARTDVGRLTKALIAHEWLLGTLAERIQLNEQLPGAHEYVLREEEKGSFGRGIFPTDEQHGRESTKHDELMLAHERMNQRHQAIMVAWHRLLQSVDAQTDQDKAGLAGQ
jgi:hypothetical protein